jgi:hypothetical protein
MIPRSMGEGKAATGKAFRDLMYHVQHMLTRYSFPSANRSKNGLGGFNEAAVEHREVHTSKKFLILIKK